MKDIPVDLIKYAFLDTFLERLGSLAGTGISTLGNVLLGGVVLGIAFSIGTAHSVGPVGEAVGASLKSSPYAPLSSKQIENMMLQDKLILGSERIRRRKESEIAQLAEKLIKEKYKL